MKSALQAKGASSTYQNRTPDPPMILRFLRAKHDHQKRVDFLWIRAIKASRISIHTLIFLIKHRKTRHWMLRKKPTTRLFQGCASRVEHIIADLKTFKILADRYRNKRKHYCIKFNIISGIVNLKNGFSFA